MDNPAENTNNTTAENNTTTTSNPDVESLKESVTQLSQVISQQNEAFTAQLAELKNTVNTSATQAVTKEAPAEDDSDGWWKGWDPETKKVVKAEAAATAEKASKKTEDRIMGNLNVARKREDRDRQAMAEYPSLADPNSDFHKAWLDEYSRRIANDPSYRENVDAIYDTASFTFAKLVKDGKHFPEELATEAKRLIGINDAHVPAFKKGPPTDAKDLTESQSWWAERLNVPVENYLKRLNNS